MNADLDKESELFYDNINKNLLVQHINVNTRHKLANSPSRLDLVFINEEDSGGGIARFTRVLFELPCYPQFELEIHIVEVSYFTNILIKLSGLWWSTLFYRLLQRS